MRLEDVRNGVKVQCRRAVDGNKRVYLKQGVIVSSCDLSALPLVRFHYPVGGHGRRDREWYCGYRSLRVRP